ncbi:MAG: CotH kinase family protein [Alphaproteobacteria bacterium]|nr:CotH kinase family protein [Alphaproteobacteria bacterium]
MIPLWLALAACGPGTLSLGGDDAGDSATPDRPDPELDGRRCALESDLESPYFLEGDEVSFTLTCVGDLPQDEAEITLLSAPGSARFDAETLRFTWETALDDGGRHDLVFQVRPRGADDIPVATPVSVWVADDHDASGNVPVDPLTYTEEWGLPVLHVDPQGQLSQSDVAAELTYMGRAYAAQIKIRGAASAGYPKNSFTLELTDEELEIDAWGRSRNHLVLLTTFDDNSYVRQKLIYDLWQDIAAFQGAEGRLTPRSFFCVLYLDGEYHGLYVALDRIDDEFTRHFGYTGDGNLYKSVNHDGNFYLTDSSGNLKYDLAQGYEKKEGEPENDYDDLRALVSFTGNASDQELFDGAAGWLDLEEFMDWQLLVTYTSSGDSAGKNAYLYNDLDGAGFHYVPWDFNHAWGQNWYTARTSAQSVDTYTSRNRVFLAFERSDADTLWGRFDAMRAAGGPFDPAHISAQVDDYYDLIAPSAQRDWEMWESEYRSYRGWSGARNSANDWEDFEGERAYLYDWLDERAAVFEERVPLGG